MKKVTPIVAILGLFLAASPARATAPDLIPVQGVLLDSAGDPVDTTVSAVFSIYTTETGGTALYTETQSVLVEDGLFTAYIGDVTTLDLATFRDNDDLWLGINIDSDGEMPRVYLGSVPFAGYAEYCGNVPTLVPSDLPTGVVVGPLSCSTSGHKVTGVDSSGGLTCEADVDTDTTYTAGTGLTLSGTTFSADTSVVQSRVTGVCTAGNSIREINADGTVICEPDTDTNTTYSAGFGLDLSGTTFVVDPTEFNGSTPIADSYTLSGITSNFTAVTLATRTITAPTSGHIAVIGKTGVYCPSCSSGQYGGAYVAVMNSAGNPATAAYEFVYAGDYGQNTLSTSVAMETYAVSAGTYTYYLRAQHNQGVPLDFHYRQLLAFFIPD
jgi:hypothetical protein